MLGVKDHWIFSGSLTMTHASGLVSSTLTPGFDFKAARASATVAYPIEDAGAADGELWGASAYANTVDDRTASGVERKYRRMGIAAA